MRATDHERWEVLTLTPWDVDILAVEFSRSWSLQEFRGRVKLSDRCDMGEESW